MQVPAEQTDINWSSFQLAKSKLEKTTWNRFFAETEDSKKHRTGELGLRGAGQASTLSKNKDMVM